MEVPPEAITLAAICAGEELAGSSGWLGDLDSNQGCPVQSREFYR